MTHKLLEEAIAHHRRGNLDRAETLYRKILKAEPADPDALHLLGCVELKRNHRERAISLIRRAVDLSPAVPLYHENLAEAYHRDGRADLAGAECRLALRFDPKRPKAMNRLGVLALENGAYEEASEWLTLALDLSPNDVEVLVNLAAVLVRTGDWNLAIQSCELALRLSPAHPLAWSNLGLAFRGLGRRADAAEAFRRAGDHPMACFNLGYMAMLDDDLGRGLPLLEMRRRMKDPGKGLSGAEWDGHDAPGARLLIVGEQGLGDTLLMARFFVPLLERFRTVSLVAPEPLVRLIQGLDPRLVVASSTDELAWDVWCPLMSLPLRLGVERVGDLPMDAWVRVVRAVAPHDAGDAGVPGLPDRREDTAPGRQGIASAPARAGSAAAFRAGSTAPLRAGSAAPLRAGSTAPLRAGINWAGNPKFAFDRIRSTRLGNVTPLLEIDGVSWVSLHRGPFENEARDAGLPAPLEHARDLLDTAEVIAGLDLVVSTETAVPNLSAAMGVPTIVLAAVDHDWRWRSWYQGVEICAQEEPGDWSGAVNRAAESIRRRIGRVAA